MAVHQAASLEARFAKVLASKPRIVLGTASSSRRAMMDELAKAFGFSYDVRKADIDEKAIRHDAPRQLVSALAEAKAAAIVPLLQSEAAAAPGSDGLSSSAAAAAAAAGEAASTTYLITCDQVVVHEGRILEKPADANEARAFIRGYARSHAQTVGSVLCTRLDPSSSSSTAAGSSGSRLEPSARAEEIEVCTILMDPLPEETTEALIAEGEVLWCAGGLMVEHPLVRPHVRGIDGGGEDSVMGLGKAAVMRVMVEAAAGSGSS